ncbi:cation:H+ antiporter [Aliiroseovarius sediminilitoris]|uniref:Cation:H+ antiporter n=1 Tax=Aliiroseovarius sediminilitoris TaxID=1173584 RepID=A0A1I0NBL6_9RHOB|nr:calcium/sodium antiporter [Aliiroseovarius sediminilitoris]SEV98223.1 cation:H+ antiporter [Aliiroseovarius sediminilitoris]
MDLIYAMLGLVILLFAGDSLVRGAVNMSLRLGVPALIVSLTVVAFGTSAPELLISVKAIFEGVPGLAMGNVVGSNTANILLVLGVPAVISGLSTATCDTRKSYLQMMGATLLFIILSMNGVITWIQGLVLLAALGLMLNSAFRVALSHRRSNHVAANDACCDGEEEVEGADPDMPWWKVILFLVLGLIGLPLGADLLVDASTNIARHFGVSETVIGLTLVALGTSLPELATTVMAALRNQAEVALGNVIGSNMFNLLAIIGIASLVGPIPIERGILHFDLWVMLGASLLLAPFVFLKWHMGRIWGVVLSSLYVIYVMIVLGMS